MFVGRHIQGEMPVNVAVEEPRAGVVRLEANRDVVAGRAGADRVVLDGVDEVVVGGARGADDPELVLCVRGRGQRVLAPYVC